VDSCGIETPVSLNHKTIHLSQNAGLGGTVNLAWDYYDGFSYTTYYIWRHDPSTNWMKIDSLPSNLTTYTDLAPPSANSRYMIQIDPPYTCTSTAKYGNTTQGTIVKSKSNITNNKVVGVTTLTKGKAEVSVYPNPFNSEIIVRVVSPGLGANELFVTDLLGNLVYSAQISAQKNEAKLELSSLRAGVYLLRVQGEGGTVIKKIVKH
jgi:hypothetical protein